jgi:hypothetical protein
MNNDNFFSFSITVENDKNIKPQRFDLEGWWNIFKELQKKENFYVTFH